MSEESRNLSIPTQPGALANAGSFGIDGIDGLDASDVTIPRYEIVQPAGRKSGAPGQLHHNLTGEALDVVRAVILRISRTRVLWSGEPGTSKGPECSSQDGVVGRTYGQCASCQFNRDANPKLDQELKQGLSVKSCDRGFTYLACDPADSSAMFMISMYRSSATAGRILNSQFVMKRRSPYEAVVVFKTKLGTSDKGKYYVYDPVVERWLSPAEYAEFQACSRAMQGVAIREVEPEEGQGNTGSMAADIAAAQAEVQAQERGAQPASPASPTDLDPEGQSLWDSLGATKPAGPGAPAKPTTTKAPF